MKKEIQNSYEKIFNLESLIIETAKNGQNTFSLEIQMKTETYNYLRLTNSILRCTI